VWDELARAEWITVPTGPEAFAHEGWPIYAEPDLVYRPDERRVVILDWKTGDDTEAELQIPLYTLYCRTVLGLPFREGAWFGRVVNLATGNDATFEISRYDVMRVAERIRESVQAMQALVANPDLNTPRPITDFPLRNPARRHGCPYCPFYTLCQSELEAVDRDGWED
jgi:hypothetical protein